jgi:hypothetical protein
MCGTIDLGSCIRWVLGFDIKIGYDSARWCPCTWSGCWSGAQCRRGCIKIPSSRAASASVLARSLVRKTLIWLLTFDSTKDVITYACAGVMMPKPSLLHLLSPAHSSARPPRLTASYCAPPHRPQATSACSRRSSMADPVGDDLGWVRRSDASPCIVSSRRTIFAHLLSYYCKMPYQMPHLLEKKLTMHIALREAVLLLHFAIGVSLSIAKARGTMQLINSNYINKTH